MFPRSEQMPLVSALHGQGTFSRALGYLREHSALVTSLLGFFHSREGKEGRQLSWPQL